MYLCEKSGHDCDPLVWWKLNEGRFKKKSHVAKSVLSVPATSVPSERVFSCDTVIFLKKNEVEFKTRSMPLVD
jgi:hypothetical protein